MLAKILNEDPVPPEAACPNPARARKNILRCLRKDPGRRYQTMADLKLAFEDLERIRLTGSRRLRRGARYLDVWRWAVAIIPIVLSPGIPWVAIVDRPTNWPLRDVPLTHFPARSSPLRFPQTATMLCSPGRVPKQDNPDLYVQQIGSALRCG